MITEKEAISILFQAIKNTYPDICQYPIRLSRNGRHWIINRKCTNYDNIPTGVGSWIVNRENGELKALATPIDVDEYLDGVYYDEEEGEIFYVLVSDYKDNVEILHLRKLLDCSLKQAKKLLTEETYWFSASRIQIEDAIVKLNNVGINSKIEIKEKTNVIPIVNDLFDMPSTILLSEELIIELLRVRANL